MMKDLWEFLESYRQEYPNLDEILKIFRLAEEEYEHILQLLYPQEFQPTNSTKIGEYNVYVSRSATEY